MSDEELLADIKQVVLNLGNLNSNGVGAGNSNTIYVTLCIAIKLQKELEERISGKYTYDHHHYGA